MTRNSCLILLFIFSASLLDAQSGVRYNSEEALNAYTLFENEDGNYLINNCGEVVNHWPRATRTDLHAKLLPNGNLIYIREDVIERDWNGNIVKATSHSEPNLMLNYEVIVLENGNYLCLARRIEDLDYFLAKGYDIRAGFPQYADVVVEMVPGTGEIVWEWNLMDHVIQQRDASLANYGILADNPRKLNMDAVSTFDWEFSETFMINGFDYNPELDQIALSVRKISEVVIIDHSTTTEEARGSTGGRYGHGGDALFRWGNPQNYDQGTESDRRLWYQHNPNWILYGEHKGKLMIYNNGLDRPGVSFNERYSSIEIVDPLMDQAGNYILENDAFQPMEAELNYNRFTENGPDFFSGYTSGAKVMPNGNIHVTVGARDKMFEINSEGEVVWEYNIDEGTYIYRSEKYPTDYAAFDGKDLTPSGVVEFPPTNYDCQLYEGVATLDFEERNISITQRSNTLILESKDKNAFEFRLYSLSGQLMQRSVKKSHNHTIDLRTQHSGIYVISIEDAEGIYSRKFYFHI